MPESPIRKLTPFADQAKKSGKHIFHLNIGQPDIETPQIMLDAIKSIDFKVWAYTPSEGTASYREKLAEYYNKLNYKIKSLHRKASSLRRLRSARIFITTSNNSTVAKIIVDNGRNSGVSPPLRASAYI